MNLVYRILLKLAGALMTTYLLPLCKPELRSALETVAPIAERYMLQYVGKDYLPGTKKKELASGLVWEELRRIKQEAGITQGDVDTAIQLAYHRMGLDKREMK